MTDIYKIWSEIYDQVYSDVVEDVEFYLQHSKLASGPILELGCGTGRITIPILDEGFDISGLDSSQSMMQTLQNKTNLNQNATSGVFLIGNMINAGKLFDRKFKLIIAPYRGFQSLLTVPEQEECLIGLRNILDREHKVIIDFFTPSIEMFDQDPKKMYKVKEIVDPEFKTTKTIWHRTHVCLSEQTLKVEIKIEVSQNGFIKESHYAPFSVRYTYPQEAKYLFQYCGYEIVDVLGDYKGNPHSDFDQDMIWIIRKQENTHVRI